MTRIFHRDILIVIISNIENQSNTYSEITNSRTYYDKKLDENVVMKYKSNNPIVYNNYHDFENRRMTLELTKYL